MGEVERENETLCGELDDARHELQKTKALVKVEDEAAASAQRRPRPRAEGPGAGAPATRPRPAVVCRHTRTLALASRL